MPVDLAKDMEGTLHMARGIAKGCKCVKRKSTRCDTLHDCCAKLSGVF